VSAYVFENVNVFLILLHDLFNGVVSRQALVRQVLVLIGKEVDTSSPGLP